jgi:hypothetical protein
MRAAAPDDVCRGIVHDGRAPIGPRSAVTSSAQVRGPVVAPGSGTGWLREVELRPPPGVAQADRLMDEQDRRDRHDLMMQEARRLAAEKSK